MTRLSAVKLGLAAAAVVAFAWGLHAEDERATWIAMILLGAAFLLRFLGPRPGR